MLISILTMMTASCAIKSGPRGQISEPGSIKAIAVLPLENFSKAQFAHEKIGRALISELVSIGMNVIEPGEVTRAMSELKIKRRSTISISDIQALGKEIRAPFLIMGSVANYGMSKGLTVSYPEISVHLMLVDTMKGSIVRSVSHSGGGVNFWTKHFGVEGKTLSEVEAVVVTESVEMLFRD
jgi:hypothetical protein